MFVSMLDAYLPGSRALLPTSRKKIFPVAPAVWSLVRMGIISLGAYGLYKATGVY